ncbi:MAG: FAD-dependent oxidoreductase, partial [Thermoplasmata archaeon]|nr:FAD-dependent oxidoreductase [Thermoplasmata archaeon]
RVTIVYRRTRQEMPAIEEEIDEALAEGIIIEFLAAPIGFKKGDDGLVNAMTAIRMELGEPDASGRRRPVKIEGSEHEVKADIVIMAIGAGANPLLTRTTPDLEINKWGYIEADESGRTSKDRVWAGGDIVTGSATVIEAMGAGKQAAMDIHEQLMGISKPDQHPEALPEGMMCQLPEK